jgi:hypothetical protein
MNKKIQLPALLLAAVTAIGIMIPQNATARDRHADDRGNPPKFAHHDRERHQLRHQRQHYRHQQHRPRHAPRWMRHYQRQHAYGHQYRPWRRHPGFFADKHALKKHYRRMERKQHHYPRHDRSRYGRHNDSNIHFRIDYWD